MSRDTFNAPLGSEASGASLPWINRLRVSPWKVGIAPEHHSLKRLQGIGRGGEGSTVGGASEIDLTAMADTHHQDH